MFAISAFYCIDIFGWIVTWLPVIQCEEMCWYVKSNWHKPNWKGRIKFLVGLIGHALYGLRYFNVLI